MFVQKTNMGVALKFLTQELRNSALPQIRKYVRENIPRVRAVPSSTSLQRTTKSNLYEAFKDEPGC